MIDQSGYAMPAGAEASALIDVGRPSLNIQKAGSMLWQAMSPIAPQPKSHQPRHWNGTYALEYGRSVWGPSQAFQSSVGGTSPGFGASVMPCAQIGRSDQVWISAMSPKACAFAISAHSSRPEPAWPWLPICVTTLCFFADSSSAWHSA